MRRMYGVAAVAMIGFGGCAGGVGTDLPAPATPPTACHTGDTGVEACGRADGAITYRIPSSVPVACPGPPRAGQTCARGDDGRVIATSSGP
jgi:hypothetical protein